MGRPSCGSDDKDEEKEAVGQRSVDGARWKRVSEKDARGKIPRCRLDASWFLARRCRNEVASGRPSCGSDGMASCLHDPVVLQSFWKSSRKLDFSPVWLGDDLFILVSDVASCFGRLGTFVATGILPLAEKSPLNEVMIIMCMSSKADKLCDSKYMLKVSFVRLYVSFVQLFLSNDMVYAY